MTDILITIIVAAALLLFWVILFDSHRFVVRRHTVTDKKIRRKCRAVLLTDLHNKCYGRGNEGLLAAIRSQQPDFVLIAGDMITANTKAPMEPVLQLLEELAKDYPIYYANGNHEQRLTASSKVYGEMAGRYDDALRGIGIRRMRNTHISLPEYGLVIYGCEIDLGYFGRFQRAEMDSGYLSRIMGQAPKEEYVVLLAHNPDYFPRYAAWGADLTLSGHVHGGVARVPFWGKGVIAPTWRIFPKYDGGVFDEGKAVMVLSRGLGSHTIPVRVFNPAELWVVEFQPKETDVLS